MPPEFLAYEGCRTFIGAERKFEKWIRIRRDIISLLNEVIFWIYYL
jgi:hypothetical protein